MKHIALYRKYRPDTFEKLIDQNHVSKTIINQIKEGKLSHAYLFSGPRGTGKTTTAKIISRVVNCLNPQDYNPCNVCSSCKQILSDSFLDVIEMDAASHNGVDDIREITEGVKFPPSLGKMKVIIIDEAHMLSKGAFNALLKTLEDPPSYVIFILATTEPNKIPQTIISRCQKYDFKRIDLESMVNYLKEVSKSENINISDEALKQISIQSGGAMRDALSLLEQVSGTSSEIINIDELSKVLGSAENEIYKIIECLLKSDLKSVLEISRNLYSSGKDVKVISQELIEALRKSLLYSEGVSEKIIGLEKEESEFLEKIGAKGRRNLFLLAIEEFINISQNKLFENEWAAFEYILGRICTKPESESFSHLAAKIEDLKSRISALENSTVNNVFSGTNEENKKVGKENLNNEESKISDSSGDIFPDIQDSDFPEFYDDETFYHEEISQNLEIETEAEIKVNKQEKIEGKTSKTDYSKINEKWENILKSVQEKNKAAHSILKKTSLISVKDGIIKLGIPEKLDVLAKSFGNGGTGDILKESITEICNLEVNVEIEVVK